MANLWYVASLIAAASAAFQIAGFSGPGSADDRTSVFFATVTIAIIFGIVGARKNTKIAAVQNNRQDRFDLTPERPTVESKPPTALRESEYLAAKEQRVKFNLQVDAKVIEIGEVLRKTPGYQEIVADPHSADECVANWTLTPISTSEPEIERAAIRTILFHDKRKLAEQKAESRMVLEQNVKKELDAKAAILQEKIRKAGKYAIFSAFASTEDSRDVTLDDFMKILSRAGVLTDSATLDAALKLEATRVRKEKMLAPYLNISSTKIRPFMRKAIEVGHNQTHFPELVDFLSARNIKTSISELETGYASELESVRLAHLERRIKEQSNTGRLSAFNWEDFEKWVGEKYVEKGYSVQHVGQTGDQGADLIATRYGERTVIQAKFYIGSVGNSAVQEVVAAKRHYNATSAAVITTGEFTRSARELALSNEIILVDRTGLAKFAGVPNIHFQQ